MSADRPWWSSDGGEGASARTHAGAPDAACQICPVCTLLRTVGETRPELIEHLSEAVRHLTLAAKAAIDAQVDAQQRGEERLERIPVDDG